MSLNDFEIIKRLGEGAYSSVYHVRRINDNDFYALKKVRMMKLSDKEKENALNEVRILASIRHPNIVAYREAFIDEPSSSLCIVMEYADSGDLFQQICDHQKNNTLFKEDDIWKIFIQIVRGLKCLHEIMIFHRDLKSANVFLSKNCLAKLGDMNVSKVAKKGLLYTQTGTPYYASPEVWRDQPYDSKSDIWSLGCVLYESITLKPPFRAEDMQGLYKKVLRGIYPKIPSTYSADLAHLVKSLIQVSPQLRPSCDKILDMPIIKKRMDKLFPNTDEFYDSHSSLLNTIRVPKNLLYLTDRLPKPTYESPKKRADEEEKIRRKTHDAGAMLPDIKNQKQKNGQLPPTGVKKSKNKVPQSKPSRKSDLKSTDQPGSETQEETTGRKGTATQLEEDRRSVISKSSVGRIESKSNLQEIQNLQPRKQGSIPSNQGINNKKNSLSQQQTKKEEGLQEEYENDYFENDENNLGNHSNNSPGKQSGEDKESILQDSSPTLNHITPASKRSHNTKVASPSQLMMANRPGNISGSVERIYVHKNGVTPLSVQNNSNPYIANPLNVQLTYDNQTTSKKNLAYINISGEGARAVGHLGLKKVEKDLIMRRYKYHMNDNIQRVALIYGNPPGSNQNQSSSPPSYNYQLNNGYNNSPYLNNQQQLTNISGIMKRNKNLLDDSSNQGYIKLPRIQSLGRPQDNMAGMQQQSKMLPSIASNALNNNQIAPSGKNLPPPYQNYILKPSKIKNISKPLLSQGISGEKMIINTYGQTKDGSNSIVSTQGIMDQNMSSSAIGQTQASTQGSPAMENRKQYKKKNKLNVMKNEKAHGMAKELSQEQ